MFMSQGAVRCRLRSILRIGNDFGGELAAFVAAEVRQLADIHSGILQISKELRCGDHGIIHGNIDLAAAGEIFIRFASADQLIVYQWDKFTFERAGAAFNCRDKGFGTELQAVPIDIGSAAVFHIDSFIDSRIVLAGAFEI